MCRCVIECKKKKKNALSVHAPRLLFFNPAQHQGLHTRWPKYWSFSFAISLSNEHSRLMSFRIDWFDLITVQGTFKSLLQNRSFSNCINSLALSLLCSSTLTSIHDYWQTHSFDYMHLCWQSNVFAF